MAKKIQDMIAPGTSDDIAVAPHNSHSVQLNVASINTNITINFQVTIDGTNWATVLDDDITIAADGTYIYVLEELNVEQLRVNWVAETGGTDATVGIFYKSNN